ncbi:MAG: hypothetical protein WD431_21260 [Cyclobacteriaceae bacterium]
MPVQATRYVGQLAGAAYVKRVAPMYLNPKNAAQRKRLGWKRLYLYGFKGGRTYARELDQRMLEEEMVRQQLSPAVE